MEQIFPNVYRFEVPLRNSPLKEIHCYLIRGEERGLLIDTAFNTDENEQVVLSALAELGLTLDTTDVFLTHMHVDHSGLCARLKRPGNKVYASPVDADMINGFQFPEHWTWITRNNDYTGVCEEDALKAVEHVAYLNRPGAQVAFDLMPPGSALDIAGYHLEVVDVKGHTPGHVALFEPTHGLFFCGDHILTPISPNICAWDLENDYLEYFLDSLKRVRALNIQHLLPAHRLPPEDIRVRVDQLIQHHQDRLDEVLRILRADGEQNAYQVAKKMTWTPKKGFEAFPKMQKWFACSEALAHLQYLWRHKQIERRQEGETYYFQIA